MEIFSILMILGTVLYIINEFLTDEMDENISRRLLEHSPAFGENGELEKDEESVEFLKDAINKIAQNVANKSKDAITQKQILVEAGLASDDDTFLSHISKKLTYAGILGLMGIFIVVMGDVSSMEGLMMIFLFPLVGFRLPDMKVKKLAKHRAEEVTYTLPDAIDLLSVCVEAGLGIDSAISRVAKEQEISAPILAAEFNRVGKDIVAGVSRAEALKALSKRNGSAELRSFVGLLIQSDRLGTSISQSLKVYSDSLRVKRRQRAEELASKASIKMTIPLVLFILPATFIVILAPAALSIIKMFAGGGP